MKGYEVLEQLKKYGDDEFLKIRSLPKSQLMIICNQFYIENLWHLESFLK